MRRGNQTSRGGDTGEAQDDRRMVRKTSDDGESTDYRGNLREEPQVSDVCSQMGKTSNDDESRHHRGNHGRMSPVYDDRKDDRGGRLSLIAGDRRGNQMKEEKAQLNHSSDPD
jgi:hypothetical protein